MAEPPKTWTVDQFEQYRPTITDFCKTEVVPILNGELFNTLVFEAPVKSGKREFPEYLAMRDTVPGNCRTTRVHGFISAWHRTADDEQRRELSHHNLKVFSIINKTALDECITWIREQIDQGKFVVIHMDECDYGSGEKQIIGKVYKFIRLYVQIFIILYSATPQEVLFSDDIDEETRELFGELMRRGKHVKYVPPSNYCGPLRFLQEGLVNDATPFFTIINSIPVLTEQGRKIIEDLKISTREGTGRNITVLRLTGKDGRKKNSKHIHQFLQFAHRIPELEGITLLIDKNDYGGDCMFEGKIIRKIDWSNTNVWSTHSKDVPTLVVIDQTSSRSTEWACHNRIDTLHDYRNEKHYTTNVQAQQRCNHFIGPKYSEFQRIKIYGDKKSFELSAGIITYEEYLDCDWRMKKVDIRRSDGEIKYEIRNTKTNELHPEYNSQITKNDAEAIIINLDCKSRMISERVKGKIYDIPIFDTKWFECNSENFSASIESILPTIMGGKFIECTFYNPFQHTQRPVCSEDGKEKGYLRKWDVFDYDIDIKNEPGWGVLKERPRLTICYCAGILGVAIRWHTGLLVKENQLTAWKSMYPGYPGK